MVFPKIGNVGGSETAEAKSRQMWGKWLLDARESWEEKNVRHLRVGRDFNNQQHLSMLFGNCDNCTASQGV